MVYRDEDAFSTKHIKSKYVRIFITIILIFIKLYENAYEHQTQFPQKLFDYDCVTL